MSMLLNFVKSVARNEEGQDLLEYALLVALIALIAIGAVGAAGTERVDHLQQHRRPLDGGGASRSGLRVGRRASTCRPTASQRCDGRSRVMPSPVAVAHVEAHRERALAPRGGGSGSSRVRVAVRAHRASSRSAPCRRSETPSTRCSGRSLLKLTSASFAVLAAGLLVATVVDLRTRRIPNVLTGTMAGAGLGLAALGVGGISVGAAVLGCVDRPGAHAARPRARRHRRRRREADGGGRQSARPAGCRKRRALYSASRAACWQ